MSERKYISFICFSIYIFELLYTFKNVETADARSPYLMRVGHLAIVIFIWYFVNWLIRQHPGRWLENRVFKELNKTSYGIYVLHYWLQPFIISTTAKRLFGLEALAANHTLLFPFLFFLCSLLMSYIGTKILLRTKVGRFLIG